MWIANKMFVTVNQNGWPEESSVHIHAETIYICGIGLVQSLYIH